MIMVAYMTEVGYSGRMEIEAKGYIPLTQYVERAQHVTEYSPRYRVEVLREAMDVLANTGTLELIDEAAVVGSEPAYNAMKDALTNSSRKEASVELLEVVLNQYLETKMYLNEFIAEKMDPDFDTDTLDADETVISNILTVMREETSEAGDLDERDIYTFMTVEHQLTSEKSELLGDVEQIREDFIAELGLLAREFNLDESSLARAIYLARTTEITVYGPLAIATGNNYTRFALADCSAAYNSSVHAAHLNLADIVYGVKSRTAIPVHARQVVYHELIHAIGTPWAYATSSGAHRGVYFPDFIEEALAEKLSFRMLSPEQQKYIRRYNKDGDYREYYPKLRHSMLKPRHTMSGTYNMYRYGLDLMMSKLDWQATGITQVRAEELLFAAFVDGPSQIDTVEHTSSNLAVFHKALTAASFPGLMQHIRDINEHEGGAQRVMNCFDAPDFDPHDKAFFERAATNRMYNWEEYRDDLDAEAPALDMDVLVRLARLAFKYKHGWRDFAMHKNELPDDDEDNPPSFDREFTVSEYAVRYDAVKAMHRQRMDARAAERAPKLIAKYKSVAK